nr:hypothetical protein [Polymorphobacter sp.]
MKRALLLSLLLLAACGKQGKLTPVPPRPAPLQAADTTRAPTPEQMLILPPQSAPARVDDPVEKSQERPEDRFNLPPPGHE